MAAAGGRSQLSARSARLLAEPTHRRGKRRRAYDSCSDDDAPLTECSEARTNPSSSQPPINRTRPASKPQLSPYLETEYGRTLASE